MAKKTRGSYVTGYNSLGIDLGRLLAGYAPYQENGKYYAGYKKGPLCDLECNLRQWPGKPVDSEPPHHPI